VPVSSWTWYVLQCMLAVITRWFFTSQCASICVSSFLWTVRDGNDGKRKNGTMWWKECSSFFHVIRQFPAELAAMRWMENISANVCWRVLAPDVRQRDERCHHQLGDPLAGRLQDTHQFYSYSSHLLVTFIHFWL